MNEKPIRILLVEDSPVAIIILKRILNSPPLLQVVGTARTGIEGLKLIPVVKPDVICSDLQMPEMGGLEFIREVMATNPKPILVISASVQAEDTENVFELLAAGAVDIFPKPRKSVMDNYEEIKQELITKVRILAGVSVFTLRRNRLVIPRLPGDRARSPSYIESILPKSDRSSAKKQFAKKQLAKKPVPKVASIPRTSQLQLAGRKKAAEIQEINLQKRLPFRVVAIGASTGGPQALQGILSALPSNFPVPVICVQHISEGFLQGLVDWLGSECRLLAKIASAGEYPEPGKIYFPPEGKHLELDTRGRFLYSSAPALSGHRPSVTATFNAVARYYGSRAVAILLTGMGRDGADGMLSIAQAGGLTIAQDEASCVVFGMPKEAIALEAACHILPIADIAPMLLESFKF
ncbi:MAG: chemotaxis-specific protein-glutamate methyltransferase CheB [Oscillatoria sp. SIO1A7]|nr:chemotaxis-specific protein-glutamate methyltransferase CheB [Oscillatoria sp. SIO1A7]